MMRQPDGGHLDKPEDLTSQKPLGTLQMMLSLDASPYVQLMECMSMEGDKQEELEAAGGGSLVEMEHLNILC